jgi:hypothetical protein
MEEAQKQIAKLAGLIAENIVYPLIALLIAVGLVLFLYGLVEYLAGLGADIGDGKERGRKHMLWGIIGMFIMVAAYAILSLIGSVMCGGSLNNCSHIK